MAFRHGQHGALSNRGTIWVCPTCQTQNAGPLEAGCTSCKAGADAKARVTAAPGYEAEAAVVRQLLPFLEAAAVQSAFDRWRAVEPGAQTLMDAFKAGAFWGYELSAPTPPALAGTPWQPERNANVGGQLLALVHPQSHEPMLLDTPTHTTILAALAFYRDNQLAYGGLPGQLSAQQVTDLIVQLTPEEPDDRS